MSTLIEELDEAAADAEYEARTIGEPAASAYREFAARLRARAERIRGLDRETEWPRADPAKRAVFDALTGPIDTSPETPAHEVLCRGCGKPLEQKNYRVADGCPCNAPRGVNHGLVTRNTCTCVECDRAQTGSTRYPANAGEAAVKPTPCCYAKDRSLPFHSPDCGGETPGKKETSE